MVLKIKLIMSSLRKSKVILVMILFLESYSHLVLASSITYETRNITAIGVDKADYRASWYSQGSTVSSQGLSAFTNVRGRNRNFVSHLSVSFDVGSSFAGNNWAFQAAPDAGLGGALYFDNVLLTSNASDLWWGKNWARTSELLTARNLTVSKGIHLLEIFWAERCCDGGQSARFSVDGSQNWQSLSVENLDSLVATPIPAAVWLFGSAFIGIIGMKKTAKQAIA